MTIPPLTLYTSCLKNNNIHYFWS